MDNLALDLKYHILSWIFNSETIQYLKSNNYNFKPELHKYSLRALIHAKYKIFEDLILFGLFDDNYLWVHNFKFNENKLPITNYKDLLFVMVGKYCCTDQKYYTGIIKSNKKNLNLIDKKNNTIALHYYIKKGFSEKFLCDLIGTVDIPNIDQIINKKSSKCLEMCWNYKYDKLYVQILKYFNPDRIRNFFIDKINFVNYNSYASDFQNSLHLIYKIIPIYINKLNSFNVFFYLDITKKYYPDDYVQVLKSDYLNKWALNLVYILGLYYLSKSDTNLCESNLLKKINFCDNLGLVCYNIFSNDILESYLITCYESIINGTFKDEFIPVIINTIITSNGVEIQYKNLNDFTNKIKNIIPKISKFTNINYIKFELLSNSLKVGNEDFAIKLIDYIKFDKFYVNVSAEIDNYLNNSTNKNIINLCLENNLNRTICHMIIKLKIDLIKKKPYSSIICDKLNGSFLELLFIKEKYILINMIFNNEQIIKNNDSNYYSRNIISNAMLFLSCVFARAEIFYNVFENYLNYIDTTVFYSSEFYSDGLSCLMYMIKNKMDGVLECVFSKYKPNSIMNTKINFRITDSNGNSIITWLIQHDYIQYVEKVINLIGSEIFKHIPMFVLNIQNLGNISQLSNGYELYWACKKNLNNIAWFFVSNKLGNINYFDSDGNSSLLLACQNKMETVAGTLLYSGLVDFRRKNIHGLTALDYARQNNMDKICQIIENKLKL